MCRYAEKQVGYMACAILLNEVWHCLLTLSSFMDRVMEALKAHNGMPMQKDEFLRLIINSIRNDLISKNEAFQCLALGFVGNGELLPRFYSIRLILQ